VACQSPEGSWGESIHDVAAVATKCALKAFGEKQPFRVRYDLRGIDSDVSAGLVYTPEGKLYGLTFDGDPQGQRGTSWSRQRAEKIPYTLSAICQSKWSGELLWQGSRAAARHHVPEHGVLLGLLA
jgi:hypothetical protein